ncbi:MAG: hypothetical protein LZF60_230091 [Nitrospira sp.]|nr:MAG: hypothetical protein LZF60_230091 [Nitrospira sp.]
MEQVCIARKGLDRATKDAIRLESLDGLDAQGMQWLRDRIKDPAGLSVDDLIAGLGPTQTIKQSPDNRQGPHIDHDAAHQLETGLPPPERSPLSRPCHAASLSV